MSRVAIGAAAAMRSAASRARGNTSSAAAARLARPSWAASSPPTSRPVNNRSRAAAMPTTCGSDQVVAIPGCRPSAVKGTPTLAVRAMKRRSQASATANPAPMAAPLIAAIVGTSSVGTASQVR